MEKCLQLTTEPWLHSGVHIFIRSKLMATNVFFQLSKNMKITRGEIWIVWRMYKGFPVNLVQYILNILGHKWMGIIRQQNNTIHQYSWDLDLLMHFNFHKASLYHCALIVAPCSRKSISSRALQWKKMVIMTTFNLVTFEFFRGGGGVNPGVFPLLALTLAVQLKMVKYHDIIPGATVMAIFWSTSAPLSGCRETQCVQMLCKDSVNSTMTNA